MKRITVMVALALLLAAPARAEINFNVQAFRPSPHIGDMWTINTSELADHLKWSARLMLNYSTNPLVYKVSAGEDGIVTNQLTADLMGSIALWKRLSIGLTIPVFLYNGSDSKGYISSPDVNSFSMGDVALSPKLSFMDATKHGFGVGLAMPLTIPTAQSGNFTGEANMTVTPLLILDAYFSGVKVALNTGYRFREDQTLEFLTVGDEFHIGGGVSVPVYQENIFAIGEVTSYTAGSDLFGDKNRNRLEMDLGMRYIGKYGLTFGVGGGSATTQGYGSVGYRLFAEAAFWPRFVEPEDTDGDGIIDEKDRCPNHPEDADGYMDTDGCPDPDNDNDGIQDRLDSCPNRAEDPDGFNDTDGCPDDDNDMDGVPDKADKCPLKAEDKDKFQDTDGCPDPDNDGDGIPDLKDKCPNEAEVLNGLDDDDGCPDKAKVVIKAKKIEILEKVHFRTSRARIMKDSFALLDDVANVLKRYPRIKKIRIEGHTDSRGRKRFNMRLSQARADAVMKYLAKKGIHADRMEAKGYGPDQPIEDNGTDEGRAANRRVEFTIIEQSK